MFRTSTLFLLLFSAFSSNALSQVRAPEYFMGGDRRQTPEQDSAYWNPAYRDSVANYAGRLQAYRFSLLSYDLGFTLSMLPVAGQWYVDNTMKGVVFSAARAGALGVSVIGVAGLFTKGNTGRDIGFAVGGLVVYGVLKYLDIVDVQHAVSRNNEHIVEKFSIEVNDVESTSIRHPEKDIWPERVTARPPAREPQPHREIFDRPLPTAPHTTLQMREHPFNLGIQFTF